MNNYSDMQYYAIVDISEIDHQTKEVLSTYTDHNVLTNEGAITALMRLTQNSTDVEDYYVRTIYLGDDVGDGDILSPEPATRTITGNTQSIVYQVPQEDITINYPTTNTSKISTVLDGTHIMETLFPSDVDLRFTSLTLRFASGGTLAYIRFPVRSLSRLVDIQITWTVSLMEEIEE